MYLLISLVILKLVSAFLDIELVCRVGRQILKIQVLPRYLPGFSLAGTYLTWFLIPGTYLSGFESGTQVLR
jgi:hypothetical protein